MELHDRPSRRREWILKTVFESGLILFGLIVALLLNDWRDGRVRHQRVHDALMSIEAELTANVKGIDAVIRHNEEMLAALEESKKTGKPYMQGIVSAIAVGATAWNATRDGGITNDISFATLVTLGAAYDDQAGFLDEIHTFLNQLYAKSDPDEYRRNPALLQGIFNDFTLHARGLRQRYVDALAALPRH